ncbi:hypothetical protein [Legionella sp.]|uniref:hypothetical protein n=1 Tax=Legionella sp. TaxID=459 RepID=UPI003C8BB3C5
MRNVILLMLGLILSSNIAVAANLTSPKAVIHDVRLVGLESGEGRYILSTNYVNNKFTSGSYFCAGSGAIVYHESYQLPKSQEPFHEEHLIKFSICQDETLASCQEFAVDNYLTFRNLDGYLENDVSTATIDVLSFKNMFQACEPDINMDDLVNKSMHLNDRRFAHVG